MTKCDKVVSKIMLRGHAQVVHPSNQTHNSPRRGHFDGNGNEKDPRESTGYVSIHYTVGQY